MQRQGAVRAARLARDARARARAHPDVRPARRGGGRRAARALSRGRDATRRSGRRSSSPTSALLHEHRQPECAETFFNSVACQVLHRRYYHNEFIFWRPAVATEHLEGEEPTLPLLLPAQGRAARSTLHAHRASFGLDEPLGEPAPRPAQHRARAARAFPAPGARAARPADPGARLALLPQQGAPTSSARRSTAPRAAVRRADPAERARRALPRHAARRARTSCWCCSRSRAPTSSSTWKCRRPTSRSCAG